MSTKEKGTLTLVLLLVAGAALVVDGATRGAPGGKPTAAAGPVVPISRVLAGGASVASMGPTAERDTGDPTKSASGPRAPTPGWTTLLFESAEGSFPGDNGWNAFDLDSNNGDDYWDDLTCRSFAGSWSVWCADVGDQPDCVNYDNDMNSWMIYGPFSLADADDARAEFQLWSETEAPDVPYDYVWWGASTDGSSFQGYRLTANQDWALVDFDFQTVPTLGDLTGQPEVWFNIGFISDSSVNSFEGSYVDDILIEKLVTAQLIFGDGFESGTTTAWVRTVTS